MEEIWKDIEGYEGKYQVSNLGSVKSLNYNNTKKEGIIKPWKKIYGHSQVGIRKNKVQINVLLHRLVAIAFIPNPLNLPCACHKDETLDENGFLYNGSDNLYWGTYSDNTKDMYKKGRSNNFFKNLVNHPSKGKFGKDNHLSKKINQYALDGEFIKELGSIIDAQKELGISRQSISACCRGKRKSAGGFIWKFSNYV